MQCLGPAEAALHNSTIVPNANEIYLDTSKLASDM